MHALERIGEYHPVKSPFEFDCLVIEIGERLLGMARDSGDSFGYPLCDPADVLNNLYPPHAEKMGRTSTVAGRFSGIGAGDEGTEFIAVARQALRPWGKRTISSESFIAAASGHGQAAFATVTISLVPTRRASQSRLNIAPEKTISALKTTTYLGLIEHIDRSSVPFRSKC